VLFQLSYSPFEVAGFPRIEPSPTAAPTHRHDHDDSPRMLRAGVIG
jgi:hypothetical protein